MRTEPSLQLSLLSSVLDRSTGEDRLVGLWSGGDRFIRKGERLVCAHVWFHFQPGGEATMSFRSDDRRIPSKVHGRWWLEGDVLVMAMGKGEIRATYTVASGVLRWADEVLVRNGDCPRELQGPTSAVSSPSALAAPLGA